MKKCGYCSRKHDDSAIVCECRTINPFGPANLLTMAFMALETGAWTPLNDISTWQESSTIPGDIDFDKMAAKSAGVFIKRAQALRVDADGVRNYERSKGKLRRGAYLYLDWTRPLVEQVNFFFAQFVTRDELGELPPVLDYEEWMNAPHPDVARQQLKAAIERAEYHLKRFGWDLINLPILLYTSPGYWATFGSADSWWAYHCDLWIAHYYVSNPLVPLPWLSWTFWQYSDKGDGLAHGVESKQIDMDWFGDDLAAFERYALPLPGGTPKPPPEPVMQNYQIISVDGVNLRSTPLYYADKRNVVATMPYLYVLQGIGEISEGGGGVECWVKVQHPQLGPLWAAFIYGGKRYLKTV